MRPRQLLTPLASAVIFFFAVAPTLAEPLKKVLILDVINLDKEANFDYLVGSITEALKENLKQNFVYLETAKEEWQRAALAHDLVFTEESHTRTYSLDLGIAMKQDIAISGGFKVRTKKGTQVLEVIIFLLDVKKRELIDTVTMQTPTSGEMFTKINKLADQLSLAAAKVLPGKEDYAKNKSAFGGGDHSFTITTRTKPLTVFGMEKFDESDQLLRPSQYALSIEAGARYEINNFWRTYGIWGQAAAFFSPVPLESTQRSETIRNLTAGLIAVAGAPWPWVVGVVGLGVGAVVAVLRSGVLSGYQQDRLLVFLDPERDPLGAGYQLAQVRLAIGSGGWWGEGFMEGRQTQGGFVPYQLNDFIFSTAAEELGFVGTVGLLGLLGFVVLRILLVGVRSRDGFGRFIGAGVGAWFAVQIFQNVGMNLGLMPVTGLPLPFVSYGGSSMFAAWLGVGLVNAAYVARSRDPHLR